MASKSTSPADFLRTLAVLALLFATTQADHYRGYGGAWRDGDGRPPWWDGPHPTETLDAGTSSETGRGGAAFTGGFNQEQARDYRTAHGVMAAVAFVAMFPLGATFVRILPGKWALYMHAIAQILAFLLFIAAAALGIWILVNVQLGGRSLLSIEARQAHPILGIMVLILILVMPVLGFMHHAAYKKHKRRTTVSHVHIWLGRILIVLGIITGGLGLQQTRASEDVKVAYAIVAAVSGGVWLFFAAFGEFKRRREQQQREKAANTAAEARGPPPPGGAGYNTYLGAGAAPAATGAAGAGIFRGSHSAASSVISGEEGRRSREVARAVSVSDTSRRASAESDRRARGNKELRGDGVSEISSRA